MKKLVVIMLAVTCLLTVSCSGQQSDTKSDVLTVEEISQMSSEQYSDAICDIYVKAMTDLGDILTKYPKANDAMKADVDTLYERTVQELLPFGKASQSFSAEKKKAYDTALLQAIFGTFDGLQLTMDTINARTDDLNNFNQTLWDKVSSMDIITRYADFDLIKQQDPAEAARLGIK
jgi:hypothetical protein